MKYLNKILIIKILTNKHNKYKKCLKIIENPFKMPFNGLLKGESTVVTVKGPNVHNSKATNQSVEVEGCVKGLEG